jgi:hypothetical protein
VVCELLRDVHFVGFVLLFMGSDATKVRATTSNERNSEQCNPGPGLWSVIF